MGGLCHGAEDPRGAPPPPRSATPTRSSTSAILLSRTHPLRPHDPHDAAPESAPAASSPTRVRARNGRTPGWPCGAPHADGRPRSSRNAPPPKRICRRRPSSPHSPCTVQIVRPLAAASQEAAGRAMRSTAPWTTAGAFVRRACHSPRRPGCSDPGLHLLRLAHPTPSTPSTAMTLPNEQSNGTSSESRGRRLAATPPRVRSPRSTDILSYVYR